jgi:ABC-2 type transport system permease protein
MTPQLRALLRKELIDLSRNRAALMPVAIVALVAVLLPFVITVVVPAATGQRLGSDADLVRVSSVARPAADLQPDARVQLFLFEQFLLLFLLLPITGALTLAAHSVVSEKQARTLEPLLAAPIGTIELLLGKVLGALIPTLAMSLAGLAGYFLLVAIFAEPGVLRAMMSVRTALVVFLVGPAAALVSLQAALIVSSRVNDARTAQQVGVLIILPLTALLVAQFTGMLWLTPPTIALVGAALLMLWVLLILLSAALFRRETILTRWR